jgi:hypothetical protein
VDGQGTHLNCAQSLTSALGPIERDSP